MSLSRPSIRNASLAFAFGLVALGLMAGLGMRRDRHPAALVGAWKSDAKSFSPNIPKNAETSEVVGRMVGAALVNWMDVRVELSLAADGTYSVKGTGHFMEFAQAGHATGTWEFDGSSVVLHPDHSKGTATMLFRGDRLHIAPDDGLALVLKHAGG